MSCCFFLGGNKCGIRFWFLFQNWPWLLEGWICLCCFFCVVKWFLLPQTLPIAKSQKDIGGQKPNFCQTPNYFQPQNTCFFANDFSQKTHLPTWQFFVPFLGWLSDPFKGCKRDLQIGHKKVTAWITWSPNFFQRHFSPKFWRFSRSCFISKCFKDQLAGWACDWRTFVGEDPSRCFDWGSKFFSSLPKRFFRCFGFSVVGQQTKNHPPKKIFFPEGWGGSGAYVQWCFLAQPERFVCLVMAFCCLKISFGSLNAKLENFQLFFGKLVMMSITQMQNGFTWNCSRIDGQNEAKNRSRKIHFRQAIWYCIHASNFGGVLTV